MNPRLIKLYVSAAAFLLLMGLSWYAYSTTKALGAEELKTKQLTASLEEFGRRLILLDQAFTKSREVHDQIERNLRRRIGELSRVPNQPCFDDPIPDAAASILRDLPGLGVPEAPSSADGTDPTPGAD